MQEKIANLAKFAYLFCISRQEYSNSRSFLPQFLKKNIKIRNQICRFPRKRQVIFVVVLLYEDLQGNPFNYLHRNFQRNKSYDQDEKKFKRFHGKIYESLLQFTIFSTLNSQSLLRKLFFPILCRSDNWFLWAIFEL